MSVNRRIPWPTWTAVFGVILVIMVACDDKPDNSSGFPPGAGAEIPEVEFDASGRPADQLEDWAKDLTDKVHVPVTALEAYAYAAAAADETSPDCGIGWTTLAGIARTESQHGQHDGATIASDGTIRPGIRGIPLDGRAGVQEIRDTDRGILDGDRKFDRAVGPFQFIPSTWIRWGVDANGDGRANPDNIDDAALTAARYLCANDRDLRTAEGWQQAILSYNNSMDYVHTVFERANDYAKESTD
ncbi:MAG: lytic murein transglycosylase [Nocardiaceae bacterium]|nr:lytic murein transglycosylase [Nocardiaceae bacterium]